MNLGISDFRYADLYDYGRLRDLADAFDAFLKEHDGSLFNRFVSYRADRSLSGPQESELLIEVSRPLGVFLAQLFDTDDTPVRERAERDSQVARFKKDFVMKRVAKVKDPMPAVDAGPTLSGEDPELALAILANRKL